MKKLIIFSAVILSAFVLTGCNPQNTSKEEPIETVSEKIALETNNSSSDIFSSSFIQSLKKSSDFKFSDDTQNDKFKEKAENSPDIPDEKLYTYIGLQTPDAKKIISESVGNKFRQPDYIPDNISFNDTDDDIFIYSMLFNNFQFYTPFPVITGGFAFTSGFYKYFGHFPETRNKTAITNNKSFIEPLFYASDEDFGIKIQDTDRKDELLLYMTESNASLDDLYSELIEKAGKKGEYEDKRIKAILEQYTHGVMIRFEPYYKIPFISITKLYTFDNEYKNKNVQIGETKGKIENTLSAIRIKLNNEESKNKVLGSSFQTASAGGYSQSENRIENEYYYFDRPFVLFLRKAGSDKPYFAVRINNEKYLIKAPAETKN